MAAVLDHVDLPVRDLSESRDFYERALAPLGYRVLRELDGAIGMGASSPAERRESGADPGGDFWISQHAADRSLAPVHIAFRAANEDEVRAFHLAALAAGGTNNGHPRHRPSYHQGYFAAYVFDPDGNNIEAVIHTHLP